MQNVIFYVKLLPSTLNQTSNFSSNSQMVIYREKFVEHGTFPFQPGLVITVQIASQSLGQIFFYSDLKFTAIHSLK